MWAELNAQVGRTLPEIRSYREGQGHLWFYLEADWELSTI